MLGIWHAYMKKDWIGEGAQYVDNLLRELKKNISGTLGDGIFEEEYIEKFNLMESVTSSLIPIRD